MAEYQIVDRKGRDTLGEGPLWSPSRGCLLWVDIYGQQLWSLTLADGIVRSWTLPERTGWVVERRGRDDLLAGFKSGIVELTLDPLVASPLLAPEPDRPHNRLNDAKVDLAGRLWFGSKDDRDQEETGALYRLDERGLYRMDDGYAVTNGPAFSPDGTLLYHTDSGRRTVYRFKLGEDGRLGPRETFIQFEEGWGYPDGMTVDADGNLWIAHWSGGRISRFNPAGRRVRSIALPARNITNCTFAGEGLDRLFVTSAALDDEEGQHAGALFEVDAGVKGLAPTRYGG